MYSSSIPCHYLQYEISFWWRVIKFPTNDYQPLPISYQSCHKHYQPTIDRLSTDYRPLQINYRSTKDQLTTTTDQLQITYRLTSSRSPPILMQLISFPHHQLRIVPYYANYIQWPKKHRKQWEKHESIVICSKIDDFSWPKQKPLAGAHQVSIITKTIWYWFTVVRTVFLNMGDLETIQ